MTAHHLPDPRDGDPLFVPWTTCADCLEPVPEVDAEEGICISCWEGRAWIANAAATRPRRPRWPLILAIVIGAVVAIGFVAQWRSDGHEQTPVSSPAIRAAVPRGEAAPAGSPATLGRRDAVQPEPEPDARDSGRPRAVSQGAVRPVALPDTATVLRGTASHVGRQFGPRYLALPQHRWGRPGITVTICGPAACVTRTSTDAGPDKAMQRAGRVADLNAWDFERVCGCPSSRGLVRVTIEYGGGPVATLPPTDTEEETR